eukprot:11440454-Alexandrium_andersonii.AAC.1
MKDVGEGAADDEPELEDVDSLRSALTLLKKAKGCSALIADLEAKIEAHTAKKKAKMGDKGLHLAVSQAFRHVT